ncbi:MAG: hypothetical protein ALAOOOJD_02745 [bacterium]|nr:hypothetical protein [bacterium]
MHCTSATPRRCRSRGEVSAFLLLVVFFTALGCGLPPQPRYLHRTIPIQTPGLSAGDILRARLIASLDAFRHTRYRTGGTDPNGVDCSGLVKAVFAEAYRVNLPHNAAAMYKLGQAVSESSLQTADLVFFQRRTAKGAWINHVGIYLAERRFVHATLSAGVIISSLDETHWRRRYAGARRPDLLNHF